MDKLRNLLTVKSIVTIVLTFIFAYLAITNKISGQQFLTIYSIVIAFYFGTQFKKNEEYIEKKDDKNEVES